MRCHVMSCHEMWCVVMWCNVMSCHEMCCDVMSCDVMWCDVLWCGVIIVKYYDYYYHHCNFYYYYHYYRYHAFNVTFSCMITYQTDVFKLTSRISSLFISLRIQSMGFFPWHVSRHEGSDCCLDVSYIWKPTKKHGVA